MSLLTIKHSGMMLDKLITYGVRQRIKIIPCSEARLPYSLFCMRPRIIRYSPYTFCGLPRTASNQITQRKGFEPLLPYKRPRISNPVLYQLSQIE